MNVNSVTYTVDLAEVDRTSIRTAGGKGANLGEMIRAGFPIPPRFIVTSASYRQFIRASGIESRIRELTRSWALDAGLPSSLEPDLNDLQRRILESRVPLHIRESIRSAYEELGAKSKALNVKVAVRSSATAEDLPTASFAGQQETYLNISGSRAVEQAVRQCWASLWSDRAVNYRSRMGFDHDSVDLAVVVQALIPAEVAGVMFTNNPLTNADDEFMITASYGLGEAVVSGGVTPDTFILSKDSRVKKRDLGSKAIYFARTDLGVEERATPAEDQTRFCLSDRQLASLVELGKRVMAHFDSPQDTEWAIHNGNIYLLQARPVTTRTQGATRNFPFDVSELSSRKMGQVRLTFVSWLSKMLSDHITEPLYPLDFSLVAIVIRALFLPCKRLGFADPLGRPFVNKEDSGRIWLHVRPLLPGVLSLFVVPYRIFKASREDVSRSWAALLQDWNRDFQALQAQDLASLDAKELYQLILGFQSNLERFLPRRFECVIYPGLVQDFLVKFWAKRASRGSDWQTIYRKLYLGVPYYTSRMNAEIARLAQISRTEGRESSHFNAGFNSFLDKWGSRPVRGMVSLPSIPAWKEDPSPVYSLVSALEKSASLDATLSAEENKQTEEFLKTRGKILSALGPIGRRLFLRHLELARRYLLAREDNVFHAEKVFAAFRAVLLEFGRRLSDRNIFRKPEDVFFLTIDELEPDRLRSHGLENLINRRKSAFLELSDLKRQGADWVSIVFGAPLRTSPKLYEAEAKAVLRGLAASPGRASGTVCVVRGPEEFDKLREGQVLVAPATTPTWTPLFRLASAVVTDAGGPLSHAAIVAREYGIPAVLGVGRGTATLKNGQQVTVDGSNGLVAVGK